MIENQKTRLRFEKVMNTFAEVFGKPITSQKNRIYFSFLKRFSLDQIEVAAERIVNEKKISTFPTIAEIIEKINPPDEQFESDALEAWNKANELIIMGARKSGNPVLDRAIELAFGSWQKFGETNPDNESFDRRHFINCHKIIVRKERDLLLSNRKIFDELDTTRERIKQLETGEKEHHITLDFYRKKLMKKYKLEIDKAKKARDFDRLDEIENTIRTEVAQKSQEL